MVKENVFAPLLKQKYFEKVELLKDGGCRFERRYTWRTVKCEMSTPDKFDEFEISFNWVNCLVLGIVSLGGGLAGIIVIGLLLAASGLHTKEDLLREVKRIIEKNK